MSTSKNLEQKVKLLLLSARLDSYNGRASSHDLDFIKHCQTKLDAVTFETLEKSEMETCNNLYKKYK